MMPFRREKEIPPATPDDGRNKIILRFDDFPPCPLTDWWGGCEMYADSRSFRGSSSIKPMRDMYVDYDGSDEALEKGGMNALITFMLSKYNTHAFPLGYAEHGPGTGKFYIGRVDSMYGHWDSGQVGVLLVEARNGQSVLKRAEAEEMAYELCKEMSYYWRGEVFEVEYIDGNGESDGVSGPYYGDEEYIEGIVENVPAGWKDFIIVSEGEPPVSEYVEKDIIDAIQSKRGITVSKNRKPTNAPRTNKLSKTGRTSSKPKRPVRATSTAKRKTTSRPKGVRK